MVAVDLYRPACTAVTSNATLARVACALAHRKTRDMQCPALPCGAAGLAPGLAARSRHRCRQLPRIQHGLLHVIEPQSEPCCCHAYPGKAMRGDPKARRPHLARDGGQRCPPAPWMIS